MRLRKIGICKDIPSVSKSLIAFHAKDDCPEVRHLVFSALSKLDFRVNVVVARKRIPQFREYFQNSQDKYYDHLVGKLFGNQLHVFAKNTVLFARRGAKARQHALREAVESAVAHFLTKHREAKPSEIVVETKYPNEDGGLQAADYAMWAVQRAFEKSEMRYFEFLREKYHFIWDIFDFEKKRNKQESKCYTKTTNPFDITKASPLS